MKFEVDLEVAGDVTVEQLAEAIKLRLETLDLGSEGTLYINGDAIKVTPTTVGREPITEAEAAKETS